MKAKQFTTFSVNGRAVPEICDVPVTLEADEPQHLESGVINVYPQIEYQTINGFGGAITETVGYLLSKMDKETRRRFLEEHFGADGQRYKFTRMHIDSCDYSLEEYAAVKDPVADPEFETFTIDRDQMYMLPVLKEAMEVAAEPISVLLSPWSPPKQWKTPPARPKNDASVYGGFMGMEPVDYDTPSRCNGGSLKPEYYTPWAKYLCKYIQAYLGEGVPVTMLSLQNESIAATNWDSCVWTAAEQKTFLKDHLYPAFQKCGLADKVGIYIWDHNKERIVEFAGEILDGETSDMIEGIAFHWYSGDHFEAVAMAGELFPGKTLMSSECCALHPPGQSPLGAMGAILGSFLDGGMKSPQTIEYDDATAYAHDIIGGLNAGMNQWIDWNLCVDKDGGPRHVARGFGAPVCANDDGTYRKTITFDYIGHFSRHILPGAKRVGFSRCNDKVDMTAAKNPDGTIVLELLNRTDKDLSYAVRMDGQIVRLNIAGKTMNTVVIEA